MIELRDASFGYAGSGKLALSHIQMTIADGDFVGITGPSGLDRADRGIPIDGHCSRSIATPRAGRPHHCIGAREQVRERGAGADHAGQPPEHGRRLGRHDVARRPDEVDRRDGDQSAGGLFSDVSACWADWLLPRTCYHS